MNVFPEKYVDVAVTAIVSDVATTPKGQGLRNKTLNEAAFKLGGFVGAGALPQSTAETLLLEAAQQNGYVADHGPSAARATISDGLKAGARSPREYQPNDRTRTPSAPRKAPVLAAVNGTVVNSPVNVAARVAIPPQEAATAPATFPERTPPDKDGKPYFMQGGDDGPPKRGDEIRRHVYKRGGVAVRVKVKRSGGSGWVDWYRVTDGDVTGWQTGVPNGYGEIPYIGALDPFDRELLADDLYWPEGEKDVETLSAHGVPAFTFAGTGGGVPQSAEAYTRGRNVIILADNDKGGRKHADKKAAACRDTAASVKVIHFAELPEKGDVSDWIAGGKTADDLRDRAEQSPLWEPPPPESDAPQATARLAIVADDDERIYLVPQLAPPADYPVGALGPTLGEAAVAISRKVQAPIEIAAQSVLAAASLAAQAHGDVQLPYGQTRPLSLYVLSIANSGDRKTSTDSEALWPVRKREVVLAEHNSRDAEDYRITLAAWEAEKRRIEGNKKLDYEARKRELKDLGPAPLPPLHPFLTAPEPTIEGLTKAWVHAPASLGLFTAEGGQFVGGHGMSQDHKLKTAAALSELWDGRGTRRLRAGDGLTILNGRRLSMHMMVQPDVAAQFLSDRVLRDQGLLSRVLVAAPPTLAGQRTYRATDPRDADTIKSYGAVILRLLEKPTPLADGKRNELVPPLLTMDADAEDCWRAFYDRVEMQSGPDGIYSVARDVAAKAAEHAARIAGVVSMVESQGRATIIDGPTMAGAVQLAEWYLGEALRLAAASMTDPAVARAVKLLDWLRARSKRAFTLRNINQFGPCELRPKAAAESALKILIDHGWVAQEPGRHRYRLTDGGAA